MADSLAAKQARLEALRKARDSGALTVMHNGESVTYRSLSEIERIISTLEGEIGTAAGTTPTRRTYGAYRRGDDI